MSTSINEAIVKECPNPLAADELEESPRVRMAPYEWLHRLISGR